MQQPLTSVALLGGLVIVLGSCSGAPSGDRSTPPPGSTPAVEKWVGVFSAYPGARELCTQRVYGSGDRPIHFTWWAYVSTDDLEDVTAFYTKQHGALRRKDVDWFSLAAPDNDASLSVHEAAKAGYPTCDRKPGTGDRTVIIVSNASGTWRR